VSVESKPFLATDKPESPCDDELAQLLSGVPTSAFHNAAQLGWLLELIPKNADERKSDSPFVAALVRLANGLLESPLPADENMRGLWKDFFKRLPNAALVRLPIDSAEADSAIKRALSVQNLPVALLWQDWRNVNGSGTLSWSNIQPLLQALGGLDLNDENAIKQRSDIAVRLLDACPERPRDWPPSLADFPLFACRLADGQTRSATLRELQAAADRGQLFISGQDWAADLAKAAPGLRSLIVGPDLAKVLQLQAAACDAGACVTLLKSAAGLDPDFTRRWPLFKRLLQGANLATDVERRSALRCLLHGQIGQWSNDTDLLSEKTETDVFTKLARLALDATGQGWRLIPHEIARNLALNENQRELLRLCEISAGSVERLLREVDPKNVDCANLTPEDCNTLLLQLNDVSVLCGLNIHETTNGRRVRIRGHTYVDDSSFQDLPEAFNALVTRIRERSGYGRFQNPDGSNRLVNKLSWEAVIEIALDQPQPDQWWDSILTAIGQLGSLRAELRKRLQDVDWLPLASDGAAKPAGLLHLPGAEAELDRLPPEVLNGKIPILRLDEPVRKHERFETFLKVVLPAPKEALATLAGLLKPHPVLSTGLTGDWTSEQVEHWVDALADAPNEALPVAGLVAALRKAEAHRALLSEFLRDISGCLSENAYAEVLKHLSARHERAETGKRQPLEEVFLHYLRAIDAAGPDFARRVLARPGVCLLNAAGRWKAAGELAPPTAGLSAEDVLSSGWASAMPSLIADTAQPVTVDGPHQHPDDPGTWNAMAAEVRQLFEPWRQYLPAPEPIGAFLSLLTSPGPVCRLAPEFFQTHSPESVGQWLQEHHPGLLQQVRCSLEKPVPLVRVLRGQTVRVRSLLGEPFEANRQQNPDRLILDGDPSMEVGTAVLINGILHPGPKRRVLRFLPMDPGALGIPVPDAVRCLQEAGEQIIKRCTDARVDLAPLFSRLSESAQVEIQVAQSLVVESALGLLRQIGGNAHAAIRQVLERWDKAHRSEASAESLGIASQLTKADEERRAAKAEVRRLLQADAEAQSALLKAVRQKLAQYQYDATSVPFELWQNADDAVRELEALGERPDPACSDGLVIMHSGDRLATVHFGRLINQYRLPGGPNREHLGFNRDLEKMVVQSISEKTEVAAQTGASVTGKFGLGFKSVFLVSDAPEVLSGSVDFVIRGGIYPVRLPAERRDALAQILKQYAPDHWRRGTVIHLPLRSDGEANPDQVLGLFQQLAPVLVIFSRRLKRLRLHRDGGAGIECHWRPIQVADVVECGKLEGLDESVSNALVLTGPVGNDRVQWLLGLGSDGFVPLPKGVPVFWVTAPTRATPGYGFAVNGPFEPDVGRVQLALNSKRNEELADELARVLANRLHTLWNKAQHEWERLRGELQLASATTPQQLAESLWDLLARHFAENCAASDQSPVAALARRSLWASDATGLRRLYADNAALPTLLWGEHRTLMRLPDIRFVAAGALDREANFTPVSGWPVFRQKVAPGRMVSAQHVESVLRRLGVVNLPTTETVHLATAVEWELEQGEEYRAAPEVAGRLGQLVTPDFLKALKEGKPGEREEQEHKALTELLPKVLFQAADGSWQEPADLVVAGGEGVDEDETMRAAFAPPECRLNPAYTGPALAFFMGCRPRMGADVEQMFQWMLQAADDQTRAAAMKYLLLGDQAMRHKLATKAREAIQAGTGGWLETVEEQSWFQKTCSDEEQDELAVHLLRTRKSEKPAPEKRDEHAQEWTAEQLQAWWRAERHNLLEYVLEGENWRLLQPNDPELDVQRRREKLRALLGDPDSETGRQIWYRLFGLACLMSEGRRTSELRDFWHTELEDDGRFWTATSRPVFRDGADKVFDRLCERRFAHVHATYERAYFWRRLFYDVRKMHRLVWECGFPAMILGRAETAQSGRELIEFIRSGHLPGQAPWVGVVGQSIGSPLFSVIRALRRLDVIENSAVDSVAFFPCRPVRRAAVGIGWLNEGDLEAWELGDLTRISETLHERAIRVPELSRDYDIPLLHMGVTCWPLPPPLPN